RSRRPSAEQPVAPSGSIRPTPSPCGRATRLAPSSSRLPIRPASQSRTSGADLHCMEFLNPLALAALAAAAIPLIIHLFNFRRPRKVDFSSLEFVRELQKSTMQRVRIKQWLLLLLRMLAIACLVIAFARPTLTGDVAGSVGGRPLSAGAVVIDNSLS